MSANPMFADQVPLEDLPKNIDNFELHWIFGFGYYVLAFEKTDKTPENKKTVLKTPPISKRNCIYNLIIKDITANFGKTDIIKTTGVGEPV